MRIPGFVLRLASCGNKEPGQRSANSAPLSPLLGQAVGDSRKTSSSGREIVSTTYARKSHTGVVQGMGMLCNENSVSIQLWQKSIQTPRKDPGNQSVVIAHDNRQANVDIARIPGSNSMQGVSASIAVPLRGDKKFRFILNVMPNLWNSPSPPETKLPAMVRRSIDSLNVPQQRLLPFDSGSKRRRIEGVGGLDEASSANVRNSDSGVEGRIIEEIDSDDGD